MKSITVALLAALVVNVNFHVLLGVFALDDESRIESILASMTLQQKINQMAQIDISLILKDNAIDEQKIEYYFGQLEIGSLLITPVEQKYLNASFYRSVMLAVQNQASVPVIAGIDSVHGANYIREAILFPQPINMASTWNSTYAKIAGSITARDTQSAGINWLFSPIVGLGIQPFWSRMYETFGEDPHLVGEFAANMVEGIQENKKSAACAKHFVGYSAPRNGHDRSPSWIPVRHLYQYFVRPWRKVIEKDKGGPLTVMESYTEYDGVPNVANRNSLQTLLRQDLGFAGVVVTDYAEIENLIGFHKVAADINEAVRLTLMESSVDMSMIPFNTAGWMEGVMASASDSDDASMRHAIEKRIDRSVLRILRLKEQLSMFDMAAIAEYSDIIQLGSTEDRQAALNMARDSIVLTKNDEEVLPILSPSNGNNVKVHVTGPTANSLRYQTGGWTIEWQGPPNDDLFQYGHTVLNAAESTNQWDVTSSCGVNIMGDPCDDVDDSIVSNQRAEADYIIVCVGEENYTGTCVYMGPIHIASSSERRQQ